jgi:hypothetical protein
MSARRIRGHGGMYFDQSRHRWIAAVTVGYSPAGKRIVRKASGTIKTAAQRRLKAILRDYKDRLLAAPGVYTVASAVTDWLAHRLMDRRSVTVATCTSLATTHVIPDLGARKLRELRAEDIDGCLAA